MRASSQSSLWESGGNGFHTRAIHPSHWHLLSQHITKDQASESSIGHDLQRAVLGNRISRGQGNCITAGWCCNKGSTPPKKNGICSVRKRLSTLTMAAIPWALSLEPQTSVCPHMTLVHFSISPPETRVSDYKSDFGHCPFKTHLGQERQNLTEISLYCSVNRYIWLK